MVLSSEVYGMANSIIRFLHTNSEGKRHGEYLFYVDDKVAIRKDTWNGWIEIFLCVPKGYPDHGTTTVTFKTFEGLYLVPVYSRNGSNNDSPRTFRQGAWITYLSSLQMIADEAKEKQERKKAFNHEESNRRDFGEVHDNWLFENANLVENN